MVVESLWRRWQENCQEGIEKSILEANAPLESNYTPIKMLKKKKKSILLAPLSTSTFSTFTFTSSSNGNQEEFGVGKSKEGAIPDEATCLPLVSIPASCLLFGVLGSQPGITRRVLDLVQETRVSGPPALPSNHSLAMAHPLTSLGLMSLVVKCRDWMEVANWWLTDVFGLAHKVF